MSHTMDDGAGEIAVENGPYVNQVKKDAKNKKAGYRARTCCHDCV